MLEFLASFEDEDTGWVDPADLVEMKDLDDGVTDDEDTQEVHDGQ